MHPLLLRHAALAATRPRLVLGRAAVGAPSLASCAAATAALSVRRRLLSSSSSSASPESDAEAATKKEASASTAEEGGEAAADAETEAAAADADAADAGEVSVETLQARITELEEQLEGKHDQVLRALAEADNARRRATIDVENAHKFAVGKFAKSLLDVADNLSRAAESVPEESRASDEQPTLKALYEGVVMTEKVLISTFEQHGLVKIWPLDEKFDPNLHNALFEMPDPEREPGTVGHVASAGYVLHDRCIRAAGVGIVSKPA